MPDKGITNISYNFLNLPTNIAQRGNNSSFLYRADGTKLKKTYTLLNSLGTKIINTEYLDGFQYSTPNIEPIRKALQQQDNTTMSVAKAGNEEAFSEVADREVAAIIPGNPPEIAMILSFFPTAEGFYDYENLRYIYQYKDHLGNVRVSFVKEGSSLKVMDTNDYYPFGMSFIKSNEIAVYDPLSVPYNYKYNGKELQETGMYDYGARFYMADIGRWGVVDPLSELYRRWSPYNYAMDNPIRFTDPDGMGVTGDFYNQAGKKLGTDGVKDQKVYVVTDNKEARQINRETKRGNLVNTANVSSKVELAGETARGGMMEAVARSKQPSGTDTKGNMHEEGGYYGTDKSGNDVVVASKPGDGYTEGANGLGVDPLDVNSTDSAELATRSQDQKTGTFHVHPPGNTTTKFVPEPSGADLRNAGSRYKEDGVRGNSYVLSVGNNKVYIYNSNNGATGTVIATFPLRDFSTVKAK